MTNKALETGDRDFFLTSNAAILLNRGIRHKAHRPRPPHGVAAKYSAISGAKGLIFHPTKGMVNLLRR